MNSEHILANTLRFCSCTAEDRCFPSCHWLRTSFTLVINNELEIDSDYRNIVSVSRNELLLEGDGYRISIEVLQDDTVRILFFTLSGRCSVLRCEIQNVSERVGDALALLERLYSTEYNGRRSVIE